MRRKPEAKNDPAAYRQILQLLIRHPAILVGLNIASLLSVLSESLGLGLILPFLSTTVLDIALFDRIAFLVPLNDFVRGLTLSYKVYLAAAILVGIVCIRGVFAYLSRWFSMRLKTEIMREMQTQVFRQLHDVELGFIHRKRLGDLLVILNNYTYQSGGLVFTVCGAFANLFAILIYMVLMLFISWWLTLAAAGLLLGVVALVRRRLAIRIKQAGADARESMRQLNFIGFESLSGIKQIHLFSKETQALARFETALRVYHDDYARAEKLIGLSSFLSQLLNVLALGLLLVIGTFVLSGQVEVWLGQMGLFLVIIFRLLGPMLALVQVQARVTQQYPALQSVLEFLCREDKPYLRNGHVRFEAIKEGIRLEEVTFRYDVHEADVLRDVTFDIPKGKMTAVVGASGAGKSTLVNLIARLYDCEEGRITVDGVDLRDVDIASWRSRIAVVSQDTFIFNDSVWGNLRLAKETATDDEIYHAARLAQAHDFVMALPQRYDTVLGDRGVRLSGGQQQRIAIARAILVDPQFLILDEATSELDSETELAIQTAIMQYSQGRTTLAIAHRLSTVRHADNIVVLKDGQVVEQGTHGELMRLGGHYWQLVQSQNLETAPAPSTHRC
jgi:subfamily B ATP-binding cassette protein MsbA